MRMKKSVIAVFLAVMCAGIGVAKAKAETDVALSAYRAFNQSTSATNGTEVSPSNNAGFLAEARHIKHPWMGYEVTYAFNKANQTYRTATLNTVQANAHEVTADWVVSMKVLTVRPFVLAGGGLLLFRPLLDQSLVKNDSKPVFNYGAGFDWTLIPHVGLRAQYRGNMYKVPTLSKSFTSIDKYTQSAEPVLGLYVSF